MKVLLHHILELWSYLDIEQASYEEQNNMAENELEYLYGDLCEYIDKKYKLEE